jgi:hypothetical protein
MAKKLAEPLLLAVVPPAAAPERAPAVGAFGSPADCGLAVPPLFGEVPTLLAPDGGAPASALPEDELELWARIVLGMAKAAATAQGSSFFSFIAVSWLMKA